MSSWFHRVSCIGLTALGLLLGAPAQAQEADAKDYVITDLGAGFIPRDISENGYIVGIDSNQIARRLETLYEKDGDTVSVTISADVALESDVEIGAINQILFSAGYTTNTDPAQPRLWRGDTPLGDLETFSGVTRALGVNAFDEAVGARLVDGFERPFWFDYTSGTLKTLSTLGGAEGRANDINNAGQIIGSADDENGNRLGFIYDEGRTAEEVSDVYKNLGTLDGFTGSEAVAGNDGEDVVGWVFNGEPDSRGRRAILSPLGNSLVNLGTLNHDVDSVALDINNNDQIVGVSTWADGRQRAFLYDLTETDLLVVKTDPKLKNRVYQASTKGAGIFRSDNRGETWTEINRGLTNLDIQDVEIHPEDSNIIFAAGKDSIFKSENAGLEWRSVGPDLEGRAVYSIHVNSGNVNLVFAGTNGGMYYSTDGGESWTLYQRADSEGNEDIIGVFDFIETPNQPNRMYAATADGVYRIDIDSNGIDWSSQNGEGDRKLGYTYITALAIPPQSQDTLFAATSGGGVWAASLSEGFLRWDQRATGIDQLATSLVFLKDETLYVGTNGGLFVSDDYGFTWTAVSAFGNNRQVYTLALSEDATTILYATTTGGDILRSDDQLGELGSEWTAITRGVDPPDVYKIIARADDPATIGDEKEIYLGASSGAYTWDSEQSAWVAAATTVKNLKITALAMDTNTTPTTLWAGSPDRGVFKSIDGGKNWFTVNEGLGHWTVRALAVDNSGDLPYVYAATMGGIYRSIDGGDSWEPAENGLGRESVLSLLLDTDVFPPALYAGTTDGVFRSVDDGLNWVKLNSGLADDPDGAGDKIDIVDLQKDASQNALYAVSSDGYLYRSSDQALSWQALATPADPTVYSLAIDESTTPSTLYAATASGIYKSSDEGASWIASGLDGLVVYTVVVSGPQQIEAGTRGNAVYESADGGASWNKMEAGLSDAVTNIQDLTALVDEPDWQLLEATAINSAGQIVGYGEFNGERHGFLLTPTIGLSTVDLSIDQTIYPESIKQFTPVTYRITVTNNGPDVATGIRVTDWIAPRTLFRYASSDYGECRRRDQTIRCELGLLEAGQSALINVSMEPQDKNIKVLNIARVVSNERDSDFSNNTTSYASGIAQVDRCFVATAAYGSFLDPHVAELRRFRDDYLMTSAPGRYLVDRYYYYSPVLAQLINEHEPLKWLTQALLTPIVYAIRYPLWAMALLLAGLAWLARRHFSRAAGVARL